MDRLLHERYDMFGHGGFAIVLLRPAPIGCCRHSSYHNCKLRSGTSTAGQDGNVQIGRTSWARSWARDGGGLES